jgi:two-component system, NarL family, response regulator DegU
MNEKISIIMADDHPIVRKGLRLMLDDEPDLEILAECSDGAMAIKETLAHQPDVLILDVDMPHKNGLEVLEKLKEESFTGKVILLTVHSEQEFFDESIDLGANGYLLKDGLAEEIVIAIKTVITGQSYISPALTTLLLRQKRNPSQNKPAGLELLTRAERQILKLIADYQTNNDIAETLFISPTTVKKHRRNICEKLELEGNHSLMKFAIEFKDKL